MRAHPSTHPPTCQHAAPQGNTAVYLLYAHARIAAIIRKSGKDPAEVARRAAITLSNDKEVALALHIARFPGGLRGLGRLLALFQSCEGHRGVCCECECWAAEGVPIRGRQWWWQQWRAVPVLLLPHCLHTLLSNQTAASLLPCCRGGGGAAEGAGAQPAHRLPLRALGWVGWGWD